MSLPRIPVFYDPRMLAMPERSFSPSAGKPREVVASWQAQGYPLDVQTFAPVTREMLQRAHEAHYVEGILGCTISNGFGDRSAQVAESLPWTSGAMLAAARAALANGEVASAPCSGFHHAHWKESDGFCTFNGLMVTAMTLLAEGAVKKVGILDADMHYGDGTEDIITRLGVRDRIHHVTFGEHYRDASQATEFLLALWDVVDEFRDCDVLLYQAGADPHIEDPLGGWLTTAQMRERDRIVFTVCQQMALPVAWNLAGGYQRDAQGSIRPVLEIHDNTMAVCVQVYGEGD
jgi:acetoin utilization deacetylase AcuC-like enzyme